MQKDEKIIAAVQFEIKPFDFFSTSLNSSLIIFIGTYTVNCRSALDRLCVHMNIILLYRIILYLRKKYQLFYISQYLLYIAIFNTKHLYFFTALPH